MKLYKNMDQKSDFSIYSTYIFLLLYLWCGIKIYVLKNKWKNITD